MEGMSGHKHDDFAPHGAFLGHAVPVRAATLDVRPTLSSMTVGAPVTSNLMHRLLRLPQGSFFIIWSSWWLFSCMREHILATPARPYRSKYAWLAAAVGDINNMSCATNNLTSFTPDTFRTGYI
jgi:hypothetical protein